MFLNQENKLVTLYNKN